MAAKRILFAAEGRARLLEGANVLAGAVETTLGPGGRFVLLEKPFESAPLVTKDGASVADEIEVGDRFANLAVEMIK